MAGRKKQEPADYSTLQYWIDDDGDPCIGNICFRVKFNRKTGRIEFRIKRGGTCPKEIDAAVQALLEIMSKGGRTEYMIESED